MFERIIALGLIITPFITIRGQDIKELKSMLTLVFMLALGLLSVYKGSFKALKNKWALLFILFMWLCIMLAPKSGVMMFNMDLGDFWSWKPFTYILVYFLGIWAIASYEFKKEDLNKVLEVAVWCGFIMAVYCLIQILHLDQFFMKDPHSMGHERWRIGGTLGHPTFVSAYIGVFVPIAIYLKRWGKAIFMGLMIFIIQSQVSIGAFLISSLFLLWIKRPRWVIPIIISFILICGIVKVAKPNYIRDSGRLFEWKRITKDIIKPENDAQRYPLTGKGLGSFYYTYHIVHSTPEEPNKCSLFQAHNEFLEVWYNCGLIGLGLLLMAIWTMIKQNLNFKKYFQGNETINLRTCLVASFIFSAVNACGTFCWQLGGCMFAIAVVVGLLHNKEIINATD